MGTASYSVEFAMRYGINAAILVNKIEFLQAHTTRSDGYCWRGQTELFQETGLTPKMQRAALKALKDDGLIETKNTFVIGSIIKCRHFKLTQAYFNIAADCAQKAQPIVTKGNNRLLPKGTIESDQREQSVNSNPQSNQLNNQKENDKRNAELVEELFAKFWKAYPKKVGRETAKRAFIKLKPKDTDLDKWIGAINQQKQSRQWRDPQYIPYPATWLNQKRWEDVLTESPVQYEHATDDLDFFK